MGLLLTFLLVAVSKIKSLKIRKTPIEMNSPYVAPPPHAIPAEAIPYLESLTPKERELHEMAVKILGSSYFVETSHAFIKWKAAQR